MSRRRKFSCGIVKNRAAVNVAIKTKGIELYNEDDRELVRFSAGGISRMSYKQEGLMLPKQKSSDDQKVIAIESACVEAWQTLIDVKKSLYKTIDIPLFQRAKNKDTGEVETAYTGSNYLTTSLIGAAIVCIGNRGFSTEQIEDALYRLDIVAKLKTSDDVFVKTFSKISHKEGEKGPKAAGLAFNAYMGSVYHMLENPLLGQTSIPEKV